MCYFPKQWQLNSDKHMLTQLKAIRCSGTRRVLHRVSAHSCSSFWLEVLLLEFTPIFEYFDLVLITWEPFPFFLLLSYIYYSFLIKPVFTVLLTYLEFSPPVKINCIKCFRGDCWCCWSSVMCSFSGFFHIFEIHDVGFAWTAFCFTCNFQVYILAQCKIFRIITLLQKCQSRVAGLRFIEKAQSEAVWRLEFLIVIGGLSVRLSLGDGLPHRAVHLGPLLWLETPRS